MTFVTMRDATGTAVAYRRTHAEVARFDDLAEARAFCDWRNALEIEDAAEAKDAPDAEPEAEGEAEPEAATACRSEPEPAPEPALDTPHPLRHEHPPTAAAADPDPYAPESPAFARLERGEKLMAVADDLGLNWMRLRAAWARAEKERRREEAAEARTPPVMDATLGARRADPRPVAIPARPALKDGWAQCARCTLAFNAAKSQRDNRLKERPTECGGCRVRKG